MSDHDHSDQIYRPPWTHESLTAHLRDKHDLDADAGWDTDSLTCEHAQAHDAHGDPCGRQVGSCHLTAV